MLVQMSVLLLRSGIFFWVVLVVFIVDVGMAMRHRCMLMFVDMLLGKVKPDTCCHQHACNSSQGVLKPPGNIGLM